MHTKGWSFAEDYCNQKTARQEKRLQKKDFDKQLLKLNRLQNALYLQKQKLPLVPLETPYQRGWKRTFILREDVNRSSSANFYTNLLHKINTVDYSAVRDFTRKKRRKRKKVYEVKLQKLREFYDREWFHPKCKLSEEEKVLFYPKTYRVKGANCIQVKWVFTEPWRFVLQVRPNMITRAKMLDIVLEQQIQQLDNDIERHHLRPGINKLVYGKSYYSIRNCEQLRQTNPLKSKPLQDILKAVANDDLLS